MFLNLIRRLTTSGSRGRGKRRSQRGFFRPQLEVLEDRSCLSGATVSINPAPLNFTEGFGGEFLVTRTGALATEFSEGHSVSVTYRIGKEPFDNATFGKDYKVLTSRTLHFSPTDTDKFIRIQGVDDAQDEENERLTVFLVKVVVNRGGTGAIANATATATLIDDDAPPSVQIEGPTKFTESSSVKTYKLKLSEESGKVVRFDFGVLSADPTLNVGTDIEVLDPPNFTTIRFEPGETKKTIKIKVIEDKIVEPDEKFTVTLLSGPNAGAGDEILVNLQDDDKAIVGIRAIASPTKHSEFEGQDGDTVITLKIVLFSQLEKDITVFFATEDDSATAADVDYQARQGSVKFPEGSLGTVPGGIVVQENFIIRGDTKREKTQKFHVNLLSNPSIRILGGRVTVSIVDDDNV